jgi:pimeloyl-ACP methyl ester carboxylesterase
MSRVIAVTSRSYRMQRIKDTVEAAGHRLAVERLLPSAGSDPRAGGDAPWLVLLHEGLGSMLQWRDLPERLARATGCPVLLYDRWGFGASEALALPRPDDYLDREAHDALPDVLRACGIERSILIGHSDGGTIALLYAAAFPERPLGLVTIAAHVFVEDVTVVGIEHAVERWRTTDLPRRLARYHGDKAETVFRGWAETWLRPGFRAWRMTERLPRIRCPALVIQGADDQYGTPSQVEAIVAGISGPAEALLIPGAGHAPHLDAPEPVLAAIERFIATLQRGGRRASTSSARGSS